ncbi:hypothetical protein LCGC14_0705720 [marine sediment metagenome]|uniref:Rho termination factor-like N-terminal domain-containing protein n=1 Tax=marine sediment metagenome TaxID=412755 RepID=A0A0F9T2G9_9ZZZZ
MNEEFDLKAIKKELGIDVPVINTRVVGKNIELFLYGGRVVKYPLPVREGPGDNIVQNGDDIEKAGEINEEWGEVMEMDTDEIENLQDEKGDGLDLDYRKLKVKELKQEAKERGVLGYDAMRKKDLIEELERRDIWPEG